MLVTDIIEENSFDNLFPKQMSFDNDDIDDDEFLSSLQIDSDVPMSLENTLDFSLLQDNTPDDIVSQVMSDFDIKSSPSYYDYKLDSMPDFPDMVTDANELNFFNGYINPDEFLNDVNIKVEIKSEVNSPNRDTPSPSSGSSDFNSFISSKSSVSLPSTTSQSKDCYSYINTLDTPPISPPSSLTPPPLSPQPVLMNRSPTSIQIVQGTLIPITTVPLSTTSTTAKTIETALPMKKIKIQPKPIMIGGVNKTTNKKTIILSAQDFSALVQKVKSLKETPTDTPSIILKTTNNNPTIKKEPVVLPKTNINTTSIKSIVPTISKTINNNHNTKRNSSTSNSFVYDYDEKTMKKQQRMIKNRESACLSRKKKKEYVTSLENKISQLSMENMNLKTENSILKRNLAEKDVLCSCKKLNTLPTLFKSSTARKTSAVFLAVIFMVSINFGSFSFGFFNTIRDSSLTSTDAISQQQIVHHSRGLLWVDENNFNSNNESVSYYDNATSANSNSNIYPICPMFVNQTESIRLASELRRWIGEPDYFNLSTTKIDIKSFSELLVPDKPIKNLFEGIKDMKSNIKAKTRRKLRGTKRVVSQPRDLLSYKDSNHIQVFNPSNNAIKYAEFFEEIRRRDDTFYVVSFSGDHLLLPALAHNKTLRPKMALMLPTFGVNDSFSNGFVTLMQIDCEVINTSILRVREKLIPDNLRNTQKVQEEQNSNSNDHNHNVTKTAERRRNNRGIQEQENYRNDRNISGQIVPNILKNNNYKPYFIDKTINNNKNIYQRNNINFKP